MGPALEPVLGTALDPALDPALGTALDPALDPALGTALGPALVKDLAGSTLEASEMSLVCFDNMSFAMLISFPTKLSLLSSLILVILLTL